MSKNLLGNIVYLTNTEYTTLITNGTVTLASGTVVTYSENDTYIVPEVVDTTVTSGSTNTITSGAVYTALNSKVDKVNGKGLSTNDYTTDEKNKLAGIAKGAEVNVQSDWSVTDVNSDAFIKNKPTIPTVNNAKLTIKVEGTPKNTFTANQSTDVDIDIKASDLGLSSALKFIGTFDKTPDTTNYTTGNVILVGNKEFLLVEKDNTKSWSELGDESSHALKSIKIEGDGALEGGGSLEENRTITHIAGSASNKDSGLYKFSTDAYSHIKEVQEVSEDDIRTLGVPLKGDDIGNFTYTNTTAVPAAIGGISKGTTFDNMSVQTLLTKLLYPYVAPSSLSGSFNLTTGAETQSKYVISNKKETSNLNKIVISSGSYRFNHGTETPKTIKVIAGDKTTEVVSNVGSDYSNTFTYSETITANGSSAYAETISRDIRYYYLDSDGKERYLSKTKNYYFVHPFYYGVVDSSTNLNDLALSSLTPRVEQRSSSLSQTYTTSSQYAVFAYPAVYGKLTKIIDQNSFDVTNSFTLYEKKSINNIAYYVYITNTVATATNFKYTFNF